MEQALLLTKKDLAAAGVSAEAIESLSKQHPSCICRYEKSTLHFTSPFTAVSEVGVSQPETPPNPQGLSRSEVDALIAERIEQFRSALWRQGLLK